MKKISIYIIIIGFLVSCQQKDFSYPKANNTIELSKSLNNKGSINLSTIASKIEYIKLQTDSNCFLGRIRDIHKNIRFTENRIFVSDKDKLLSFDKQGKFLTQYGRRGKGPNEYITLREFTIIEDKNQIAIFCTNQQKVILFDFQGKFLNAFKIDFWPTNMVYFNNSLVFASPIGRRHMTDYYALSMLSLKGKLIKRILFRERDKQVEKKDKLKLRTTNFLSVESDTLTYWEYLEDIIWRIPSDLTEIPQYSISYIPNGDKTDHFNRLLESKKETQSIMEFWDSHVVFRGPLIMTSKYKFFEFCDHGIIKNILYNSIKKKTTWLSSKDSIYTNKKVFDLYNDIDGGLHFWPHGIISENKAFKLIYGYELKNYLNLKKKKGNQYSKSLEKIVSQSKISDNPILMIVTLKK